MPSSGLCQTVRFRSIPSCSAIADPARRRAQLRYATYVREISSEEERVWVQSDRAVARACAERGGPILDHMSTANAARDAEGPDRLIRPLTRRPCPPPGVG